MIKDVEQIKAQLLELFNAHIGPLRITADTDTKFEVTGTIAAMQGKKKVDGMYFASVVPKSKDVRLYFFPVYTHPDEVGELTENLTKALKGKSCFHIKYVDQELKSELAALIDRSVQVYQKAGLLVK